MTQKPLTLAEKLWRDHLVVKGENGAPDLLYIDLHLIHEVTSPQAFDGKKLRLSTCSKILAIFFPHKA
mgnify:CR=1